MKGSLVKKELAVVVILLFVGVAFAPGFTAEIPTVSDGDSKLVEITVGMCGLDGMENHTVLLTIEEKERFNALFDDIHFRLGNITCREESIVIFKDAIVELDNLGLLGGISVEEAEELVLNSDESLTHVSESDIEDKINGSYRNSNCQVVGKITSSSCFDVMYIPIKSLFESIYTLLYLFLTLGIIFEHEFMLFVRFISDIENNMAFNVLYGKIFIGSHGRDPFWGRPYTSYSSGWMNTYGDNGHVNFSGSFIGTLGTSVITIPRGAGYSTKHIGVVGFSGLCLGSNYIGRAREIGVRMQET